MVANNPIERVGPGQMDYLLNRIADIERRLDQGGARSSFPFSVGHLNVTDFQIVPSLSGDGSADIYIGNGAGGKLVQVKTDSTYGTKILQILDQSGKSLFSTDAFSGFGWGNPCFPYTYGGREELNMAGATTHSSAVEIGRGINFAYNPAAYIQPRIRVRSSTNETIKVYAQWRHNDGTTYDTAEWVQAIAANSVAVYTPEFAAQWVANDMGGAPTAVFIKAFCDTAAPANIFATLYFSAGYGNSQYFYTNAAPSILK